MGLIKKPKIDFNVWKITFINIRIIFSPKDYQKWGKRYLKENCNLNNWDLKTILHLLPFIFGFSNMIWSRYQDQTIPAILSQNLPGTKSIKEEVFWETFKILKIKSIDFKKIKKIDLFSNSCILEIKTPEKEKLIGILLPKHNINLIPVKRFGSYKKRAIIILDTDIGSKIQDTFYYLDEVPIKIESIRINSIDTLLTKEKRKESIFDYQLQKLLQLQNNQIKETNKYKNIPLELHTKVPFPKEFSICKEMGAQTNVVTGVRFTFLNNENNKAILLNKNIRSFLSPKERILQNELNSLFYDQGIKINLIHDHFNLKVHFFPFIEYCSKETLQILNEFLTLKTTKIDLPRILSGFKYPDIARKKVYTINLKYILDNFKKSSFLEIQLPSNLFISLEDNSLINSICCNSLPISYRKDNFFGINTEQINFLEKKNINEINWKNGLFQETIKRQDKTFEDLDDSDPDSWFLAFKQNAITKEITFEEVFFTDFVKQNSKNKEFYIGNFLFQIIPPNYNFPLFFENFILKKEAPLIKIGDLYKRTPTLATSLDDKVFSTQKSSFSFFESWEPISLNSWMLLTQFSTGLFLIHLLKDLYKDYGKELVEYVLQFANSSGIDVEELKEQYLSDDPGYRLIRKMKKSFKDIAGIDNILLQLGEIVWFLRNNGRSSRLKNSIPNGILLTGPPGTGKTLLVQAIAGEAQVPIIVESGSLLTDPQQKGRGVERLKKIFNQARQLSPCIIFIDEVDTIGEKRQNIIQISMGGDELIESIYEKSFNQNENNFIQKPLNLEENKNGEKDLEYQLFRGEEKNNLNINNEKIHQKSESKKARLNLLTQFLVEMDGLKQRQGVIVIGATNRPNVLDPALIRPGRFDQILNLELPGKQKRIEILKLYSKKLQLDTNISWEYLAKRTRSFSAADIAAAMNESTIQSILAKTTHTIATIEKGIDLVTSYNSDSKVLDSKQHVSDPFFLSRLAYYQAGKAILESLIDNHPPVVVLHLWPRQKNARHVRLYENTFSETTNRKTLEAQLIGLYLGKASELIPLYGNKIYNSLKRWHSDFGEEDFIAATFLANLLVDKWYFYSMQILIRKNNQILNTRNQKEFIDPEKLVLSEILSNELEDELEIEKLAKLSRLGRYQQRGFGPWWQIQIAKQTSEIKSFFADWYRIYLPDPEENILNLEWLPPDEYYHTNEPLKKLSEKSNISFNELYQIERDYVFHGLILNAFNEAFHLVEEKREFLDYFSDYLLRFEIIRDNEIKTILKNQKKKNQNNSEITQSNLVKILENFWGKNSRRKTYRFLMFKTLSNLKNNSSYQSPFLNFNKE